MFNVFCTPVALALDAKTIEMIWQTPLFGMAMIFIILGSLWGVLSLFKLIFYKPEKKVVKPAEERQPEPVVQTAPIVEEQNDEELIAVITAAVAAYIESEEPSAAPDGFRVVSFRRTNGGRAWNAK